MTKLGLTAFLVLFAAGIFVNDQSRAAKSGALATLRPHPVTQ